MHTGASLIRSEPVPLKEVPAVPAVPAYAVLPFRRPRLHWRQMKQNKLLTVVAIAILGWLSYNVCTDDYGRFNPPASVDHAFYRMGRAIGATADDVEGSVQETNEEMQGVVDGRTRRNDRKIRKDTQGKHGNGGLSRPLGRRKALVVRCR